MPGFSTVVLKIPLSSLRITERSSPASASLITRIIALSIGFPERLVMLPLMRPLSFAVAKPAKIINNPNKKHIRGQDFMPGVLIRIYRMHNKYAPKLPHLNQLCQLRRFAQICTNDYYLTIGNSDGKIIDFYIGYKKYS